jgi:hypothetical protein
MCKMVKIVRRYRHSTTPQVKIKTQVKVETVKCVLKFES